MKKLLFLALLTSCTLLSATEKVVVQRSGHPDIDAVIIEDDNLIIKSKGKTYKFKISELIKDDYRQAKRREPKNLKESFEYNAEWCFFDAYHSKRNRFIQLKKRIYKVFKEGDLFQRTSYKDKYYARDLDRKIFVPDWEIEKDFTPHLIPADKYIEQLNKKIKSLDENLAEVKKDIKNTKESISSEESKLEGYQKHYEDFLTKSNIRVKRIDKNGNIIIRENSDKFDKEIEDQMVELYNKINQQKKNIEHLKEELEEKLTKLEKPKLEIEKILKLKEKVDALYKKYVLDK